MSIHLRFAALVVLYSFGLAAADSLPAPDLADAKYGPHARNVLDLWRTTKSKVPAPVVVFIHGGGFSSGSKSDYAKGQYMKPFLDAGVSCASINYRWKLDVPVADILRDCARAVQWLRANAAECNIDPKRVGAWGGSAGACAALWLGTREDLASPAHADPVLRQSSRLSVVVLTATQATLDPTRWTSFMEKPRPEWLPEIEKAALALFHLKQMSDLDNPRLKPILSEYDMLRLITKDDAPIFCINVTPDGPSKDLGHWFHHPRHAEEIGKAAQAVGLECIVHPGRGAASESAAVEFVLRRLKVK